ncbi:uncharacterized protein EDB91DRAFT_1244070 [Suillus paluster]|uniref:uncharacterized protein n=1 Tax=Suillus paluster TaxID=48578 RepID=UPI001B85FB74|nr:uncharacterized protein EDB91DRAFT_1244070 [Suillus paluster]KAG1750493.1 hypothetical protein EDB91DRAFT_1244070 [Suillus paluster]
MSESTSASTSEPSRARGRGRGKSRGGLGKYLRARGRGRGGRPAEFHKRLVLEDEEVVDLDPDSEEAKELQKKYARRQLGSNADRYAEPEPELDSDGEEIREPEIDLSSFLERQRLSDVSEVTAAVAPPVDDDDIDHDLAHISSHRNPPPTSQKGRVQTIEWDAQLEEMSREKAAADASRDLKARFRAKSEKLKSKPLFTLDRKQDDNYSEAPALPTDAPRKAPKLEMEDFLDDLLG